MKTIFYLYLLAAVSSILFVSCNPDSIADEDNPYGTEQTIKRGDLDEGMVLMLDGQIYHGADCINRLALLSSNAGLFNRFNRIMFRSETLSRVMYPVLRAGRNTTLRLMGRRAIQK